MLAVENLKGVGQLFTDHRGGAVLRGRDVAIEYSRTTLDMFHLSTYSSCVTSRGLGFSGIGPLLRRVSMRHAEYVIYVAQPELFAAMHRTRSLCEAPADNNSVATCGVAL